LAVSTVWYLFFFISAGTLKIKRLESQIIQNQNNNKSISGWIYAL
jgi:hypothetical protein